APNQPAAFEKWLFGRWIEPTVVTASGDYTVATNEIPDGGTYGGGPYLYQIPIDGDPRHFLTVEGRWFDADGNAASRWAQSNQRESGLLIVEFNLAEDWYSSSPQLYRHSPRRVRGSTPTALRAYRPGDRFFRCYAETCVIIEPTSSPGALSSFSVRVVSKHGSLTEVGGLLIDRRSLESSGARTATAPWAIDDGRPATLAALAGLPRRLGVAGALQLQFSLRTRTWNSSR